MSVFVFRLLSPQRHTDYSLSLAQEKEHFHTQILIELVTYTDGSHQLKRAIKSQVRSQLISLSVNAVASLNKLLTFQCLKNLEHMVIGSHQRKHDDRFGEDAAYRVLDASTSWQIRHFLCVVLLAQIRLRTHEEAQNGRHCNENSESESTAETSRIVEDGMWRETSSTDNAREESYDVNEPRKVLFRTKTKVYQNVMCWMNLKSAQERERED